jgi:glycine cleavage system H protein
VRPEADGTVSIGMTDLAQTKAGRIMHLRVRRPGSVRPKGKPVATVETGKWAGPVPNPFDCTIEAANPEALASPERINRDPYAEWIARVRPSAPLGVALQDLLSGQDAETGFRARCKAENIECKRL